MEEKTRQERQELYAQEELCDRAIRTVARSLVLHLAVWVILAAGVLWRTEPTLLLMALVGLVLLMDLPSVVALAQELVKQLRRMKSLRAQED